MFGLEFVQCTNSLAVYASAADKFEGQKAHQRTLSFVLRASNTHVLELGWILLFRRYAAVETSKSAIAVLKTQVTITVIARGCASARCHLYSDALRYQFRHGEPP